MSVAQPLLETIEADEPTVSQTARGAAALQPKTAREPVVLTPTTRSTGQMANTPGDAESGACYALTGILILTDHNVQVLALYSVKYDAVVLEPCIGEHLTNLNNSQSSHPLALFFLYFFRIAAVAVYILSGWFTENFVLTVSFSIRAV